MVTEWLLSGIRSVEEAAADLREALSELTPALQPVRAAALADAPIERIVEAMVEAGATRRAVEQAYRRYEQLLAALRGTAVRVLVDEYGLSVSEVARRLGVSRQVVSRLYVADPGRPAERDPHL